MVDNHVRRMIIEHAPVEDIKKYAREVRKMRTLRESALQLVEQGVTTPEEMMKVRNLGRKSLEEVMAKLDSLGFKLNTDDDN